MTQQQIRGTSRVYGILGWPVDHSLSPLMQNAALAAAGVDGIYVPFPVEPARLPQAVAGLRALQVQGCNVTIPHKVAVAGLLDQLDRSAEQAGAVNTIVNRNGSLIGYNTDGAGLIDAIRLDLGVEVAGKRLLLLGAGGAARGALAACCHAGAQAVLVVNRTPAAAQALVQLFQPLYPDCALRACCFGSALNAELPMIDLLVNATSLGMGGEKFAGLALAELPRHATVYDMIYAPPRTPLLSEACSLGLGAANGLGMLAAQGERAFALWHGREAPVGVMRAVLEQACAGSTLDRT